MTNYLEPLESTVVAWDDAISGAPHRFSAREFNLQIGNRRVELGHLHNGRLLDILFSVKIRDVLIAEGKAQTHRFVPDSGWISFPIRNADDYEQAVWLLRLSYLINVYRYGRGKHALDISAEVELLTLSDTLQETAFPSLA